MIQSSDKDIKRVITNMSKIKSERKYMLRRIIITIIIINNHFKK